MGQAKAVLLGYLQAVNHPRWPGSDGLTVDDALSMYAQASAAGLVPGLAELRESHPHLADVVANLFAEK
jgi:hypothetical protein